jgi:hypothetical protein
MRRYVKLMEVVKSIELKFSRRSFPLYIVLNCCTFVQDNNRESIQSFPFAGSLFNDIFGTQFPFELKDLGNRETAYKQLEFVHEKLMNYQSKVIKQLRPRNVVELPFSHFFPLMSLANLSISRLLAVTSLVNDYDARTVEQLIGDGLSEKAFQCVRFVNKRYHCNEWGDTNEPIDLFGMCPSDWKRGFTSESIEKMLIKTQNPTVFRGNLLDKRIIFLRALLWAYDPYRKLFEKREFYGAWEIRSVINTKVLISDDVTGDWLPPEILRRLREARPP